MCPVSATGKAWAVLREMRLKAHLKDLTQRSVRWQRWCVTLRDVLCGTSHRMTS